MSAAKRSSSSFIQPAEPGENGNFSVDDSLDGVATLVIDQHHHLLLSVVLYIVQFMLQNITFLLKCYFETYSVFKKKMFG